MKQVFLITEFEKMEVHKASTPRLLTLTDARTPQERSEEVWSRIALRLGVDWTTISPYTHPSQRYIYAVSLEVPNPHAIPEETIDDETDPDDSPA